MERVLACMHEADLTCLACMRGVGLLLAYKHGAESACMCGADLAGSGLYARSGLVSL